MKITFILRNGATIDSIIPEEQQKDFNFTAFTGGARINGYVQTANMYIRHEELTAVLFTTDEMPAPVVKSDVRGTLQ